MKTAIASVAAYELRCPHCGQYISNPGDYSQFWTVHNARVGTVACECGQVVRVPKKVREIAETAS